MIRERGLHWPYLQRWLRWRGLNGRRGVSSLSGGGIHHVASVKCRAKEARQRGLLRHRTLCPHTCEKFTRATSLTDHTPPRTLYAPSHPPEPSSMFKKPVSYSGQHRMSGKDLKSLKKDLKKKLPSASDATIDAMLPIKGACASPCNRTVPPSSHCITLQVAVILHEQWRLTHTYGERRQCGRCGTVREG